MNIKEYSHPISKIEIFLNDNGKLSMEQIKAQTGCDIIFTGHWYNVSTKKPEGDMKVNGKVLARQSDYEIQGYAWNKGQLPKMVSNKEMDKYDNFLCTMPLIKDSKPLDLYPDSWIKRATSRPCFGFDKNNRFTLVVFNSATPWECQDYCQDLFLDSAMMMDGGGSTKAITPVWTWNSVRPLYNYICVWLDKEAPQSEPIPEKRTIYRVQVGAFNDPNNAERLKEELKSKGYDGFIVKAEI